MALWSASVSDSREEFPHIVFAVDEAYCGALAVAWQSMCETNRDLGPNLSITVLHERLDPGSADRLRFHAERLGLRVELRSVVMPDLPYNLRYGGTRTNYLRLAIPDQVSGNRRVLYLDADLVIRGDLRPLLRTNLGGLALGAVRDPINPTYGLGRAMPGWQQLGIPAEREYFNSGVLLLDLLECARDGLFDRAWRAVAEHPELLRLWDQDALNLAAADRWYRLPARWNTPPLSALLRTPWIRYQAEALAPARTLLAAEREAMILHYVSPAKPWRNLLPDGRANRIYQRHLATVLAAEADIESPAAGPRTPIDPYRPRKPERTATWPTTDTRSSRASPSGSTR